MNKKLRTSPIKNKETQKGKKPAHINQFRCLWRFPPDDHGLSTHVIRVYCLKEKNIYNNNFILCGWC